MMQSKGPRIQLTARIPATLHRSASINAQRRQISLNDYLVEALTAACAETTTSAFPKKKR